MASMLDMALDDVIEARKNENKGGESAAEPKKEEDAGGDAANTADDEGNATMEDAPDNGGGDDSAAATTVKEEGDEVSGNKPKGGGPKSGGGGGKAPHKGGRYNRRHQPYRRGGHQGGGGGVPSNAMYMNDDGSDRSRRVYVGNLSWDVTWRELKDHMKSTDCEVTRADVLTTHDGRSKGCGIVEFATADGARKAVLTLNDTDLMGRQIFVREDREEASGPTGQQHGHHHTGGGRFSSGGDAQSRRCYVGNLSWDVAWQDLKDHMRQAGDVVFAEVMTEPDGRSKGCGIVEYSSAEEAQEAIKTLTDSELKGRMIFVREDREITSGGPRQSCSVYVGNLAYETSWQDLKDHMRAAGNVDQANVLTAEDGRSKGCGIVQYQKPQEAARAIRELQNSVLHGRPIFVREDREQGHSGGGGAAGSQLFVGNLSYDTTWRELKDHFRQCGDVERAEVMEGPDGRKKGYGTVRFTRAKDAKAAISRMNGVELMGRQLEVRIDHKA